MTDPTSPTPLASGVWGILATPFEGPEGEVDLPSFTRQIDQYREVGGRGVVALGVFGEAAKLRADERAAVVRAAAESVADLGLVVGVSTLATTQTIEQSAAAVEAAGEALDGVMIQVNSGDATRVIHHLTAIHEATGAGIVLQDYPNLTGISITSAALLEVLAACPFVVAIKAECRPTPTAIAQLSAGSDVPLFGGLGGVGLLDELAAGAAGAMTGFSFPEGLVATVDAFHRDGFAAAREAFLPYLPLANFEFQEGLVLALRKALLHARGVIADPSPRQPAKLFPEELRPVMQAHLEALGAA